MFVTIIIIAATVTAMFYELCKKLSTDGFYVIFAKSVKYKLCRLLTLM
jgi:hypothetical protein